MSFQYTSPSARARRRRRENVCVVWIYRYIPETRTENKRWRVATRRRSSASARRSRHSSRTRTGRGSCPVKVRHTHPRADYKTASRFLSFLLFLRVRTSARVCRRQRDGRDEIPRLFSRGARFRSVGPFLARPFAFHGRLVVLLLRCPRSARRNASDECTDR